MCSDSAKFISFTGEVYESNWGFKGGEFLPFLCVFINTQPLLHQCNLSVDGAPEMGLPRRLICLESPRLLHEDDVQVGHSWRVINGRRWMNADLQLLFRSNLLYLAEQTRAACVSRNLPLQQNILVQIQCHPARRLFI